MPNLHQATRANGPRFLVLGAGAVGGYFGGRLAAANADVTFFVRPARAALLNERGLLIESPMGALRLRVQVATVDTLDGVFDTVLLTAKAYDLDFRIDERTRMHSQGPEQAEGQRLPQPPGPSSQRCRPR